MIEFPIPFEIFFEGDVEQYIKTQIDKELGNGEISGSITYVIRVDYERERVIYSGEKVRK